MIFAEVLPNGTLRVQESSVADGVLFDTVAFSFPESWNGFSKTAVFTDGEDESYSVVLDKTNSLCVNENTCYIPYEVLNEPGFSLSVFGVKGNRKATATEAFVTVKKSGPGEGNTPGTPTAGEYEQLINLTQTAVSVAQSVRTDADNGAFQGETGPKGEKGAKGDKGEKGDTGEQGPAGIQGPKGAKGDRGETGPAGAKGDKGDPGDITNIDLVFDADSVNAQSGQAVASAISVALGIVETQLSDYFILQEDEESCQS